MFLDVICRRNSFLVEGAIALRREGRIPANSYVVDLDARHLRAAGDLHGLGVFAHDQADGARVTHRAGVQIGNIGHVVQIPRAEADAAAALEPECRTVFSEEKVAEAVAAGWRDLQVNAPGANSAVMFEALAVAGATQVESGPGLTGTAALHACQDRPELPAAVYLTQVSHFSGGRAYCFGDRLYIDPIFPPYDVKAIVASEPTAADAARLPVEIPPAAIDYCRVIEVPAGSSVRPGDSVILGFRIQAFATPAYVVDIAGMGTARPESQGIFATQRAPSSWPG
jgi:hypothetical protein